MIHTIPSNKINPKYPVHTLRKPKVKDMDTLPLVDILLQADTPQQVVTTQEDTHAQINSNMRHQ